MILKHPKNFYYMYMKKKMKISLYKANQNKLKKTLKVQRAKWSNKKIF